MNYLSHDELTATGLIQEYGRGALSPLAAVERLHARTDSVDPAVQAWVAVDWEKARASAGSLEGAPSPSQPLWGVPIGVKDNIDLRGYPTRAGCAALPDTAVDDDAEVVSVLRRAGAIPLGKLATTELATLGNPPATTNPWNTAHTPGGSSAGPAAAVASGMVPIALGTQTRGSVIRPASFCGIFGLSPTPGIVGTGGVVPNAYTIDRVGAFARVPRDLDLFLQAFGAAPPAEDTPVIGVVTDDYFWDDTDPACRDAVEEGIAALNRAGIATQRVELGLDFALIGRLHDRVEMVDFGTAHEDLLEPPGLLGEFCTGLVQGAKTIPAFEYVRSQEARKELAAQLRARFEELGVTAFLTPGAPGPAPLGNGGTGSPRMSTPFTFLGLPALAAPGAIASNGLPVGVQLVAQPNRDRTLVALAELLSGAAPVERSFVSSGVETG